MLKDYILKPDRDELYFIIILLLFALSLFSYESTASTKYSPRNCEFQVTF